MRVGCIGYANRSGLGSYITNFRQHLPLNSQMVIRHPDKGWLKIDVPYTLADIHPTQEQLEDYLNMCSPDVVIIIETPFNDDYFKILHDRNIGVIYIPMIDCRSIQEIEPYIEYIDVVINNTQYGHNIYKEVFKEKAHYIPYPVDTDYFHPDKLEACDYSFLHNQGTGGSGYRKATDQVFIAFRQLHYQCPDATLRVNSQPYEHIHSQLFKDVKGATVKVQDALDTIDIYKGSQTYVAPSRREGLGLPVLEAMSCGLAVITTDAPPMNEWSPGNTLLVPVQEEQNLPYGDIPMYTPNPFELMQKMIYAYEHPKHMARIGQQNRKIIEEKFSWKVLKDQYIDILEKVKKWHEIKRIANSL